MYVQVRALENRIPIAAPNVCDDRSSHGIYRGKCIFVDFDYDYKTDIALLLLDDKKEIFIKL